MGLRINTNIAAMNAYRNLSMTEAQMNTSLERLSSGYRINRAADDAAGLSISEGLRAQIGGLKQAIRNAQDGVNVVQTADGALTEVHSILQRMRDLAVQASNTGSQDTDARQAAQTELNQLNSELDRIGSTTAFGGQNLLDGTFGATGAKVAGGVTVPSGGVVVDDTTAADAQFKVAGTFGGVDLTAGVTVSVAAGTYTSAADYQKALQDGLDSAVSGAGADAGSVKATVTDTGDGVWKVELSSSAVGDGNSFTVSGLSGSTTVAGVVAATSSAEDSKGAAFQVGANAGGDNVITVSIGEVDSSTLSTSGIDLVNNASAAISTIDDAITSVSTTRANLGAYQNRFQHTINNLNVAVENLSASESQIRDTDMAQEMVNFTRTQILSQAGTAMLAQANQIPSGVLKLLQ
jgi:flagellin